MTNARTASPKSRRSTFVDPQVLTQELLRELIEATRENTDAQREQAKAHRDVARQQHITNLVVRSQLSTDPQEKQRLLSDAARRMEYGRRNDRLDHD